MLLPRVENGRSTVYVLGELTPQELAFFNADEIPASTPHPAEARIEVLGHGIAYWRANVPREHARAAVVDGERLLRLTVAAFAVLGGHPFTVTIRNWVEARDVVSYRNVVGFQAARFGDVEMTSAADARNDVMREAVCIALTVDGNIHHRLALRDYATALREADDDAFIYAYRAVEAVRRAISPGPATGSRWKAMHERLGTSEAELQELEDVASAVRHGDVEDVKLAAARAGWSRLDYLDRARDVVLRELTRVLGRELVQFTSSWRRSP